MQRESDGAVEMFAQLREAIMRGRHMDHPVEIAPEQNRFHPVAGKDGGNSQQHQRQGHHPGCLVQVLAGMRVHPRLAVKHQEIHAEAVQGGDEYPGQHGNIGKIRAGDLGQVNRLDDAVLGKIAREERRADQRQRTDQRGQPGNGHVPAQPPYCACPGRGAWR